MGFAKSRKLGMMAGASLALALGAMGMGGMTIQNNAVPVTEERAIEVKRRRDRADANRSPPSWGQRYPTPSKMQTHSGAGGAGAHRRWKKRRAAGIYG